MHFNSKSNNILHHPPPVKQWQTGHIAKPFPRAILTQRTKRESLPNVCLRTHTLTKPTGRAKSPLHGGVDDVVVDWWCFACGGRSGDVVSTNNVGNRKCKSSAAIRRSEENIMLPFFPTFYTVFILPQAHSLRQVSSHCLPPSAAKPSIVPIAGPL